MPISSSSIRNAISRSAMISIPGGNFWELTIPDGVYVSLTEIGSGTDNSNSLIGIEFFGSNLLSTKSAYSSNERVKNVYRNGNIFSSGFNGSSSLYFNYTYSANGSIPMINIINSLPSDSDIDIINIPENSFYFKDITTDNVHIENLTADSANITNDISCQNIECDSLYANHVTTAEIQLSNWNISVNEGSSTITISAHE